MSRNTSVKAKPKTRSGSHDKFLLLDSDPANFGDGFSQHRHKHFNSSNLIKSLTIKKKWSILKAVKKLKRKDDKMATNKNKKSNKANGLKSLAWLVFAAQQAFIGYVLLSNFDNYAVIACALLSLGLAGTVVTAHFFNAHK